MNTGKMVFSQVMEFLSLHEFHKCVERYQGHYQHEVPVHHNAESYLDAYLQAAGIGEERKTPLFRTTYLKMKRLTDQAMTRTDVLHMIKRQVERVGFSDRICCHTFRATGIMTYLENGGSLEAAQSIVAHESARTTKLYDRRGEKSP